MGVGNGVFSREVCDETAHLPRSPLSVTAVCFVHFPVRLVFNNIRSNACVSHLHTPSVYGFEVTE